MATVDIEKRLDKLGREVTALFDELQTVDELDTGDLALTAIKRRGRELAAQVKAIAKLIAKAKERSETRVEQLTDADIKADDAVSAFDALVEELDLFNIEEGETKENPRGRRRGGP